MNKLKKLRDSLTENELKVIELYINGSSWVKAYNTVYPRNWSKGAPYRMKRRPNVVSYLDALDEQIIERQIMDKAKIISMLATNAELAQSGVEAKTVTTNKDGEQTVTVSKAPQLANSNKALELLGKNLGMFGSDVTINGLDELVKELKDKGDALAGQISASD